MKKIQLYLNKIHFSSLGLSLYQILDIYGKNIFQNKIGKQAASISWSFFLSLFPFMLFILSLLPYLPHYEGLQIYLFKKLLPEILPKNIALEVISYLKNFLIPNLNSLNNIPTILFALIFGTNGTYSLINGFNENSDLKRSFIREYLISIGVTLSFITLIILNFLGIYYTQIVLRIFSPNNNDFMIFHLSKFVGWVSFPFFYFILLSLFYWVGCLKIKKWKQAIPGSIFTTILFVISTYIFAFYLKKFANYNIFYGSIGSVIIIMVWININIVLLLLGNELNILLRKLLSK